MRASGICGSDLNLYRQADPSSRARRLRPRAVRRGRRARAGRRRSSRRRIGQRVMIHHYRGCGTCWLCRMGYTQMCARGRGDGHRHRRRQRAVSAGAGRHAGRATGRAVVRRGRGDLLRHRHGLRGAEATRRLGARHAGDLRPGPGRPGRDAAGDGDGRARDRRRSVGGAARHGGRAGRRRQRSIRPRTIRSTRSGS